MKSKVPQLSYQINNDNDFAFAVDQIEGILISVTNYLELNPKKKIKIRFPRPKKNHHASIKSKLKWIPSKRMATKIAAQFVHLEFLQWIGKNIYQTPMERSLLQKDIIVFSTSITEALINVACEILGLNIEKYKDRVDALRNRDFFGDGLQKMIKKQWDLRSRIHLSISNQPESYSRKEAMNSYGTAVKLLIAVTEKFKKSEIETCFQ